jgi:hypothetical protein
MEFLKMMRWLGLDSTNRRDVKEFAHKLQAGDTHLPDDWDRLEVSSNGLCVWIYAKDFINQQLHGLSFERVSMVFCSNHPPGDEVLFSDLEEDGGEEDFSWSTYFRARAVIKIGGDHFFIVHAELVESGCIHLSSAYSVEQGVVEDAIQDHAVDSSVNILERVMLGYLKEYSTRRAK